MYFQAIPYLTFAGNAKDALEYYKEVFEGEITELQTYGEADYPTPPEEDHRIMHARFKKGDLFFMVSDTSQDDSLTVGNNISLALEIDSEDDLRQTYERLSKKGEVKMELQDTFWGAVYAKVKDPFGITWDLNHTKS